MSDDVQAAMAAVERWIGNPLALSLLRFVSEQDGCGDRLLNSIDHYLGSDKSICWKCTLASRIVVWHGSPTLTLLRDRTHLKGSCGECENRLVCGGCRARAWAYYRDLHAPDPGCMNNLSHWKALRDEGGRDQIRADPPAPVNGETRGILHA